MTLSIVIPMYNEQARIGRCIRELISYKAPKGVELERVIFVNDGSRDNTVRMIRAKIKTIQRHLNAKVRIISYRKNQGYGHAVVTGMAASTSEYTLFMDADMATPLSQIRKMLPSMKAGVSIINGTRKDKSDVLVHQPKYREVMGHVYTLLCNIILNTWLVDFNCGFKMFSRTAKDIIFPRLICKRWSVDAEMLFLGRIMGFSIIDVPIRWSDMKGSKVNVFVDAPRSLAELIKIRLKYIPDQTVIFGRRVYQPARAAYNSIRTLVF
jgi:dolichyl-phosphate beta-glucosyltransferase